MTMKRNVRVGVIGTGGIADSCHLPALRDIGTATVVAVCDIVEARAKKAAARFGVPHVYVSYLEMLEKERLDAVLVLTEPDQLFRPVKACLESGLHVFMEKPPGITTCQAQTLLRTARSANRILQVGFNRRFIPLIREVIRRMKAKTKITQVEGRFIKHGDAAFYGGCASALECDTIHVIDLVLWVAGGTVVSTAMVEGRTNDTVPNRWNAVARFDNGVTGIIKANYKTGGRVHTLELHGPGASAFVNLGFGDASCSAELLFFGGKGTQSLAAAGSGATSRLSLDGIKLAGSDQYHVYQGFLAEDRHFIDCVRKGRRPLTDVEQGVRAMEFVDLMRQNRI